MGLLYKIENSPLISSKEKGKKVSCGKRAREGNRESGVKYWSEKDVLLVETSKIEGKRHVKGGPSYSRGRVGLRGVRRSRWKGRKVEKGRCGAGAH